MEVSDDYENTWLKNAVDNLKDKHDLHEEVSDSAAVARLLGDLQQWGETAPLPENDEVLLEQMSLALSQVLEGKNIREISPAFYANLLRYPELREMFVDALQLLEEEADYPFTWPEELLDHTFLAAVPPQAQGALSETNVLKTTWHLTIDMIRYRMSHSLTVDGLPVRTTHNLADEQIPLVRDRLTIADLALDVQLDVLLLLDEAKPVHLIATVWKPEEETFNQSVQAAIQWGSYVHTVPVDRLGSGRFPSTTLETLFDDDNQPLDSLTFSLTLDD